MARQSFESGDLDIDVASLFGVLWRNKGKLLATAAIITGLAGAALTMVSPKYSSEARVEIVNNETQYTRPSGVTAEELRAPLTNEAINSQLQRLSSTSLLSSVFLDKAARSEIRNHPEIKDYNNPGTMEHLLGLVGLGKGQVGTDRVISKARENLQIFRVENSNTIVISFSSEDPELARLVPNEIAARFLETQKSEKMGGEEEAVKFLESAIEKGSLDLRKKEQEISDYRSQNDILLGSGNSALATQQLSELSTELSRVRAERAEAEARAATVESVLAGGGSLESIPEILSSGLMQNLRQRQVQLQSQIADLSVDLLDSHPQMKGLRSQLADLDVRIRNEAVKVERSLSTAAKTAERREQELVSKLNGLKAESSRVSDDEVKLRELERDAASLREKLEGDRAKYREANDRISKAAPQPDAKIVQQAVMPAESYFPKYGPILGATFVASLLFSSVFLLLRELFSGRAFRAPAPVREIVQDNDKSFDGRPIAAPSSEEARTIVSEFASVKAVANRLIDEGEPTALVVSPEGGEACAASVMIARELADQGLNVLLLDLTGASSAARPMLDGLSLPGITNLLAGEAQLAAIVHKDAWSEASVIPTGTADQSRAAKAVARLPMIINALASAHDIVLIECGTVTPAGLKRIVMPGSRLLVSVINPDSAKVMGAMTELVAAGYDDLELIALAGSINAEPGRTAA